MHTPTYTRMVGIIVEYGTHDELIEQCRMRKRVCESHGLD